MSTIKANTLLHSDGSTTTQPSIPALDKRMAKAWVKFRGLDTLAINDSYNVSSITDNGVGQYTVNFTTAMANSTYSPLSSGSYYNWDSHYQTSHHTTSSFRINGIRAHSHAFNDTDIITGVVFGN
jgi:hypothetical protein